MNFFDKLLSTFPFVKLLSTYKTKGLTKHALMFHLWPAHKCHNIVLQLQAYGSLLFHACVVVIHACVVIIPEKEWSSYSLSTRKNSVCYHRNVRSYAWQSITPDLLTFLLWYHSSNIPTISAIMQLCHKGNQIWQTVSKKIWTIFLFNLPCFWFFV